MKNKTTFQAELPSTYSLIKASLVAVAVAVFLLLVAVLPAEYGIDPTGIGKRLGLSQLNTSSNEKTVKETTAIPSTSISNSPIQATQKDLIHKTLTLTLAPKQGAEVKAVMNKGDQFIFSWKASHNNLSFDMHGDYPNTQDEFTSFWEDKNLDKTSGTFQAPFDGNHGWYWQNDGTETVTIELSVSGFFSSLYMP